VLNVQAVTPLEPLFRLSEAVLASEGDMTIEYFRNKVRCSWCRRQTEDIRIVYVGKTGFGYRDH
jgi:hypothetical protein